MALPRNHYQRNYRIDPNLYDNNDTTRSRIRDFPLSTYSNYAVLFLFYLEIFICESSSNSTEICSNLYSVEPGTGPVRNCNSPNWIRKGFFWPSLPNRMMIIVWLLDTTIRLWTHRALTRLSAAILWEILLSNRWELVEFIHSPLLKI